MDDGDKAVNAAMANMKLWQAQSPPHTTLS